MKICVRCREDCSNRARVKDPEGRYVCQRCLDEARRSRLEGSRAPVRESAPERVEEAEAIPMFEDVDPSVLSLEAEEEEAEAVAPPVPASAVADSMCPHCHEAMPGHDVVCLHCGFNTATGMTARTQKVKMRVRTKTAGSGSPAAGIVLFLASAAAIVVTSVLIWNSETRIALVLLPLLGFFAITSFTLVVCAFMDTPVQGVLVLFVPMYVVYWVFFRTQNPLLMALMGIMWVAMGAWIVLLFRLAALRAELYGG